MCGAIRVPTNEPSAISLHRISISAVRAALYLLILLLFCPIIDFDHTKRRESSSCIMPSTAGLLLLILALVALLSSPVPTSAEYDIFIRHNVSRPEGGRHFWLYSPSHYTESPNPTALPLVLNFHGFTDTCEQFITQFSVFALASDLYQYHHAIMCGTMTPGGGPAWNSGYFMQRLNATSLPDDIAYTRAVVAAIEARVKVDTGRIFAMGHSNGAFMSELLACNASDLVHAIASNAGATILSADPKASLSMCSSAYAGNATSVLLIHGTADTAVPFNGSDSQVSIPVNFRAWADRNGCSGEPSRRWARGVATSEGWVGCKGRTEVELVVIAGGVHMWYVNSDFQSSLFTLEWFDRVSRRYGDQRSVYRGEA